MGFPHLFAVVKRGLFCRAANNSSGRLVLFPHNSSLTTHHYSLT